MRKILIACMIFVAAPALSAECDKWRFGRIEMEEGKAPAAWICANGEDHSMSLSCAGTDMAWLSYFPSAGGTERPEGYEGRYIIDIGDDTFRRTVLLQAMDNALVIGEQKFAGPLLAAMSSGKSLTIKPEDGKHKGDTFPLAGSTAALKSLAAACAKIGG